MHKVDTLCVFEVLLVCCCLFFIVAIIRMPWCPKRKKEIEGDTKKFFGAKRKEKRKRKGNSG